MTTQDSVPIHAFHPHKIKLHEHNLNGMIAKLENNLLYRIKHSTMQRTLQGNVECTPNDIKIIIQRTLIVKELSNENNIILILELHAMLHA